MGTRDNYESVTRVVQAFASQRTWKQADLARKVGLETRALRRLLLNLTESGMPLEKDEEHPHVYWSVPRHWFPGGVFFDVEDWDVLVHAVLRIGNESRREKLLSRLLSGRSLPGNVRNGVARLNRAVTGTPLTPEEHSTVLLIERSLLESKPLSIHYYSTSSGRLRWRTISPQRLITEPHRRLVAYCHVNRALRWFRIDNIQKAQLKCDEETVIVLSEEVAGFIGASPDGYHDGTEKELRFVVREPSAAWIAGNLLPGMRIEEQTGNEVRVVTLGGALVVARFIAGLGGDAVAEGGELQALVREMAEAARDANQ